MINPRYHSETRAGGAEGRTRLKRERWVQVLNMRMIRVILSGLLLTIAIIIALAQPAMADKAYLEEFRLATSSPCPPPVDPARASAIIAPASEPVGSATSQTSSRTTSVTRLIRSESTLTAKGPVGAPVKASAV